MTDVPARAAVGVNLIQPSSRTVSAIETPVGTSSTLSPTLFHLARGESPSLRLRALPYATA